MYDSQTAENFFQTYLAASSMESITEFVEHKPVSSNGSGENGGVHNRPQILNLADQSSANQLSPDDEVWLKFMGDILQQQPSTMTVKEENIPENETKTSEDGTDFAASIVSATAPLMKPVDSLPRIRPSPLDRVSHSGGSDQNQSPSRRSPKSPPSSPSWGARYRESPTRSPVSRSTRSPQISPGDKHSLKLLEGISVSILSVQDSSCLGGTRVLDSASTTNKLIERAESGNVVHQVQSSEFQDNSTGPIASHEDYCVDLASYAATVASSTACLMSMNTSPPELEKIATCPGLVSAVNQLSDGLPVTHQVVGADDTDLHLPLQSQCSSTDPEQEDILQSSNNQIIPLPIQTDWSPLGDLYPILDVSPSIERLEQEKMFSVGKRSEVGELTVNSEEAVSLLVAEEDVSEGKAIPSSKASGIMTPLKRCPSFSNIPSLTSDGDEAKIVKLPTELDDLTVYEEKDDNRIFDLGDFHGSLNKVSINCNVQSMESVPNVSISAKMFESFESEQVRCNLLEIEDGADLYSASSSPEVPSDISYNSIKMNVHALLSTELDEQNFILSSDDDQEIDLDEDIPPKHLIGVGRSKGPPVSYAFNVKDSNQASCNLAVPVGNNDQWNDLLLITSDDAGLSRDLRESAESPYCVSDIAISFFRKCF